MIVCFIVSPCEPQGTREGTPNKADHELSPLFVCYSEKESGEGLAYVGNGRR